MAQGSRCVHYFVRFPVPRIAAVAKVQRDDPFLESPVLQDAPRPPVRQPRNNVLEFRIAATVFNGGGANWRAAKESGGE